MERRAIDPDPTTEYIPIGIRSFGKGLFHYEPTLGARLGKLRFFKMVPGRLVISNIKGWEGAIAVSADADAGCIASNRFLTYTPTDDRIDVRWANWYFLSGPGNELIQRASPGSADRNRTLAIDRFEALEIPLPPIDEQRRVARVLDGIADQAAKAEAAFEPQGPHILLTLLPGLVDVALERAAAGRTRVAALADFVSDTVHPGDDPSPADCFIGLQHVEGHTGRRVGFDDLGPMDGRKFRFRPGDVVYGYLRPYLNKAWVADRHGLCSVDQYVLRPRPGVSADVLGYTLRGRGVLTQAVDLTHNLQLPRLRSGLLSSVEVPAIPGDRVMELVPQLDRLRQQVLDVINLRQRQIQLTKSLVPAAMNEAFAALS